MDRDRFDQFTHAFSQLLTRRALAGAFGIGALTLPGRATGKKRKKTRVKRNELGCVDVGKFCKNAGQCCSGVCQGKKGKKKCRAHDTGGCTAEQDTCVDPTSAACVTSAGGPGICTRTTGKASFCTPVLFACIECTKDVDCQQFCGPGAACVVCNACPDTGRRLCTGSGGTCSLGGVP